ncbi:MAG: 50S ribosomal protein L7/L12 [Planctomycetota bacterium]|jgi:large subunit ribosomal protein L7/L12|nr:50S ribosomal protein L7/L12 [Planctomycetota bacterium]
MSEVSEKLAGVISTIKELSVVELVELVDALKNELGLSDADLQGGGGVVMAAGGAAGGAEAAEEPTEFNVILAEAGSEKIKVIKAVREITGLGLADAKKFVESAPQTMKEAASKEEADEIKKKVEEVGAKVELKGV